jgi:DNA-directed RNA polymerase specialized sigma24 family protein
MSLEEVLQYVDDRVFAKTEKHLDTLQREILRGVFDGQKYANIAEEYKCTAGHVKDEAYKLWRLLSEVLGQDLNKSNFRATVERLGIKNSIVFENNGSIRDINLCPNSEISEELEEDLNIEQEKSDRTSTIVNLQHKIQLKNIPKLVKLGLTAEQIAEALDLPLTDVQKEMQSKQS